MGVSLFMFFLRKHENIILWKNYGEMPINSLIDSFKKGTGYFFLDISVDAFSFKLIVILAAH